jgi:hypothetical protein
LKEAYLKAFPKLSLLNTAQIKLHYIDDDNDRIEVEN